MRTQACPIKLWGEYSQKYYESVSEKQGDCGPDQAAEIYSAPSQKTGLE
jgi:hypothetical protein